MNHNKINALYGLKWNPFTPDLPTEALQKTAAIENFFFRIESLASEGGFALLTGDPGLGKSATLRLLTERLSQVREISVGELTRPQSSTPDFYREMSSLFSVDLKAANRYGGHKALRLKWQSHLESTLIRPVLIIDEAQEMHPHVLSELRLMSSSKFDSVPLLTVILAGDQRLNEKLKLPELIPLGSRIRVRYQLELLNKSELTILLEESMNRAGNPNLMSKELVATLADHSLGNPRVCMNMATQLLTTGVQKEAPVLDAKLFFEMFPKTHQSKSARKH
jgi:type II secretory pathway predicted ATPase ExeA